VKISVLMKFGESYPLAFIIHSTGTRSPTTGP